MKLPGFQSYRRVIIIGSDENAMRLFVTLRQNIGFKDISIIDPNIESINQLQHDTTIGLIIDASNLPHIASHFRKTDFPGVDILSSFSAQLIFCTGHEFIKTGDLAGYRAKVLGSLHELRHSICITKNKEELLKLVLSVTLQSLSADSGSIMLLNPRKRILTVEMSLGLKPTIKNSAFQKIGRGISGRVARSGKPILITGKVNSTDFEVQDERDDLHSSISCPMLSGDEVIGVININSKANGKTFSKDDLKYLQELAMFAASLIKATREYERTINASFVFSITTAIRDILRLDVPLQERLNLAMMRIVNSLHGEICNLYRFDKEREQFIMQASSSFTINRFENDSIRLNDFFTGRALRLKQSFSFSINMGNSDLKKWFLAQPIKSGDEIAGILIINLISDRENYDREKRVLEKIADLLQDAFIQKNRMQNMRLQSIQYGALSEVVFDLASIHNVRQLARVVTVNACMIFEAQSCIFNLYNDNMNTFEQFESFSVNGSQHIKLLHKLNSVLALKAVSEKKSLFIPDLLSEGYISEEVPTRSVIAICLHHDNSIMGALSIYDKNNYGVYNHNLFSKNDYEMFVKYCFQVTKALSRFIKVKKSSL